MNLVSHWGLRVDKDSANCQESVITATNGEIFFEVDPVASSLEQSTDRSLFTEAHFRDKFIGDYADCSGIHVIAVSKLIAESPVAEVGP